MEIILIWAMEREGGIGLNNQLPWSFPRDRQHFKSLTTGYPCVMGRKTFESLPNGPLPNRTNLVLSQTPEYSPQGALCFNDFHDALTRGAKENWQKLFVIGGSQIYQLFLPLADKLEVTRIDGHFHCDIFFPEINWDNWTLVKREDEDKLQFLSFQRN